MKVALYIRVSTQEQVENYSIGAQTERLEAYCKAKGWEIYDTYVDPGYSGASLERPGLQKLLSDVNKINAVVVYKLDRLSRTQRDTLTLIEEHFLKNNVDFVSITETLDTSTPFGKAMIGILSVFAQLERETIAERMRMGQLKRAEEGYRSMGGDYDPAGYTRKDGELVVNEEEVEHIKAAFNFYEQYHSIAKMQKKLKEDGFPVWRFRRYYDILRNKLYCGYISFAGELYPGRHTPIITEEQFDRVQVLLKKFKGKNTHKAKESLLSGLIYCGKCGEIYHTYQTGGAKKYRYYICRARRFPAEYDEKCTNETWGAKKLEELLINEISHITTEKKVKNKEIKVIDYDKQLKGIDVKIERLLSLYLDGEIEKAILDKKVHNLNEEKQSILNNKQSQEEQLQTSISADQLKAYVINLSSGDFSDRQAAIQKLVRRIVIHGESIEIEWAF